MAECFQRNRVGVGMNVSVSGETVKRFELSDGLDTVLNKNIFFYLFTMIGHSCVT